MGAQVETTRCSICGRIGAHTHKAGAVLMDGQVFYDKPSFDLVAFSMVPAPRCETCGTSMEYLTRGTDWSCCNPGCGQKGCSVTTGIGGVVGSVE